MTDIRKKSSQNGKGYAQGKGGTRPKEHGKGTDRGLTRPKPDSVSACYNFVKLSEHVYLPEWADRVSQDIPFKNGCSGTFDLRIKARSPLLVGGRQEGNTVSFFKMPDGTPTIPGTALRGMIRNVVEIVSFSRMCLIDDARLGVRDLTPGAKDFYRKKISRPNAGFLSFENGNWLLSKCEFIQVHQKTIENDLASDATSSARMQCSANEDARLARWKYQKWINDHKPMPPDIFFQPGTETIYERDIPRTHPIAAKLSFICGGCCNKAGRLVFTGQVDNKRREFVFLPPNEEPVRVDDHVINDFLLIHATSKDWLWWQDQIRRTPGLRIPVFWHGNNPPLASRPRSIGLAFMYRLAYSQRITKLMPESHCNNLGGLDMAQCIFGRIDDQQVESLRSRISFGAAKLDKIPPGAPVQGRVDAKTVILGSPRPGYYPNYIEQDLADNASGHLVDVRYRSYDSQENRIRGWKRYPIRRIRWNDLETVTASKQSITLEPVIEGCEFLGRVRFHNLREEELGAVLWAVEWGGLQDFFHSLGIGKPLGLGQVSLSVENLQVVPNEIAANSGKQLPDFKRQFVTHMDSWHTGFAPGVRWWESEILLTLLATANPSIGDKKALHHMTLDPTSHMNDFQWIKGAKRGRDTVRPAMALPPYLQDEDRVKLKEILSNHYSQIEIG